MATKPEAAKPEDEEPVKAPARSKKMLIIIGGVVLALVLAGVGAYFYISKQRAAAAADGEEAAPAAVVHAPPKTPPVYLPLDNMVVNLADPGGEKVAQIGITLEVVDTKGSDAVKAYLPTIRSGILMLTTSKLSRQICSRMTTLGAIHLHLTGWAICACLRVTSTAEKENRTSPLSSTSSLKKKRSLPFVLDA